MLPGLGHFYISIVVKGWIFLALSMGLSVLNTASKSVIGAIGLLIVYVYAVISIIIDFNKKLKDEEMGDVNERYKKGESTETIEL